MTGAPIDLLKAATVTGYTIGAIVSAYVLTWCIVAATIAAALIRQHLRQANPQSSAGT